MSAHEHHYETHIEWTGAREQGTATYTSYGRDHLITDPDRVVAVAAEALAVSW